MPAAIVARTETAFTIQIEIPYGSSMLESEETIQEHLNRAGVLATGEALQRFDTDGTPLVVADTKLTSIGRVLKEYQTPYRGRPRGTPPLPKFPGRQDLLPARPQRPDHRQLHPPVRQDHLAQVRRVRLLPSDRGPAGEPRPCGGPVVRPERGDAVAAVAMAQEEDWEYAPPELGGWQE